MSLWFGASAAAPALASQWGFTAADAGRLTLAVQLGFVAGTLASALANVSDVFPPRRSLRVGTAARSRTRLWLWPTRPPVASASFATGFFLAGVYPPGMS